MLALGAVLLCLVGAIFDLKANAGDHAGGTLLGVRLAVLFGLGVISAFAAWWLWTERASQPVRVLARGRELAELTGHDGPVYTVAFGPDGTLITGGIDRTIRNWRPDVANSLRCFRERRSRSTMPLAIFGEGE